MLEYFSKAVSKREITFRLFTNTSTERHPLNGMSALCPVFRPVVVGTVVHIIFATERVPRDFGLEAFTGHLKQRII